MKNRLRVWITENRWGLITLAAVWLIFFSRILIGTHVYFLDDLKIIYYPLEVAYTEFQHNWQLPQWSPYFGFGHPLLAWGQLGFFTPLHLLLRALSIDPLNLLQISVAAYFALGLTGMYAFLRQQRLSIAAATLGGIVYTFSGFNIGHLNHVNFYVATMVVPWLLLAAAAFFRQPTLSRAGIVALIGAVIPLSGQPQITLYCYLLVLIVSLSLYAVEIRQRRHNRQQLNRYLGRTMSLTLVAALLAFALASLAILPLFEFIPHTERAADLPVAELFEFSYPASHAITLLFPYFFGSHNNYWGAKGFQELSAFIGVIPILLSAAALALNRRSPLVWAALALFVLGLIAAPGIHSPIYRYLIENHILTTLNIPGRFVFFITTGIALLAALGLNQLNQLTQRSSTRRQIGVISGITISLIFLPTIIAAASNTAVKDQLKHIAVLHPWHTLLVFIGILAGGVLLLRPRFATKTYAAPTLVLITTITLLAYSWNYNPVIRRSQIADTPSFTASLTSHEQATDLPPRLYSREHLLKDSTPFRRLPTPAIAPDFSVHQPLEGVYRNSPCFIIPIFAQPQATGGVTISLRPTLTSQPIETHTIAVTDIQKSERQRVCFESLPTTSSDPLFLSITSNDLSGINIYYQPRPESKSIYLVRVADPTSAQLEQSQKLGHLIFEPDTATAVDIELLLLARHLQATANASSARWIGALSIRSYREFIEFFLANDREPIDGDNIHVVERFRHIFDLAGVTHLAQQLEPTTTDHMSDSNFRIVDEAAVNDYRFRLYTNPAAFPKAFLVPRAVFSPADDETRAAMSQAEFNPREVAYISGPMPPPEIHDATLPADATARLTKYSPTLVEIEVSSSQPAWLVLNDSTTPQWQTFIDNEPAPYYVADTVFKAAQVPAGQHTVTFRYHSPATEQAKTIAIAGLIGIAATLVPYHRLTRYSKGHAGAPPQTS